MILSIYQAEKISPFPILIRISFISNFQIYFPTYAKFVKNIRNPSSIIIINIQFYLWNSILNYKYPNCKYLNIIPINRNINIIISLYNK